MKKWLTLILACITISTHAQEMSRFLPFEPSHAIYQRAAGDEWAVNARYSFRFILASDYVRSLPCKSRDWGNNCSEIFFSYTGEFDFYLKTRASGPVINRVSNPAIHFRHYRSGGDWIDVALEHRSNGQTTEVTSADGAADAQKAYAANEHSFFDGVSRGSNFLSLEYHPHHDEEAVSYYVKAKKYLTQDSDVTWGPYANSGVKFSDYDLLKFVARKKWSNAEVSLVWTIGNKGLATDSWDFDVAWFASKCYVPVYLRYHHGPMRTLSNYTHPQNAIGFGIKFAPLPDGSNMIPKCDRSNKT